MRVVSAYVVGRLFMAPASIQEQGPFVGFVMSLGAGFYEELSFRVILFGLGAKVLVWLLAHEKVELTGTDALMAGATTKKQKSTLGSWFIMLVWAVVCALVFSGVHYVGAMGDSFKITSFAFRAMLGLVLTLIYVTRGFAAAVWTHAVYDIWVLVFH
jgi:membrane protease YdiL (CAAX protease family)